MNEVLMDTCIFSRFFSKRGPSIEIIEFISTCDKVSISCVTHFEVQAGLRKSHLMNTLKIYPDVVRQLNLSIYDFDASIGEIAAIQLAKMHSKGRQYSMQDLWIGATAKALGLKLGTINIKDFDHWNIDILNPLG